MWGQAPDPCPPPPPQALTLRRRPPPLPSTGIRAWLRACLLEDGAPCTTHAPTLVAEALHELSAVSSYTKRLGVIPESFVHILNHALRSAAPQSPPPSLQYLSSLMPIVRVKLWESSLLCIRAAHSARCWFIRSVVARDVVGAEEALSAQRRYERRRAGPPSKRRRVSPPCPPPVRVSARPRTRPKLPGFSVAWMGEYIETGEDVARRPEDLLSPANLCHLI